MSSNGSASLDGAAGLSNLTVTPTAKRLRIAVLNRNFDPRGGGAERYSIALVEQMAARHDIHVFAQTIRHQFPGVTYHAVSMPFARPRWINQLWYATATWWATRRGFDVVHSHENTWHGQVQTIHVLPIKHNLFVGRHGMVRLLRWIKVATSPRLLAYLWLEQRRYAPEPGRMLVVTSQALQAVMASTHPHTLSMMKIITPGVTDVLGAAKVEERLAARHQLGLPRDGQLVLFVANDFHKKGLTTLLEALAGVRSSEAINLAVVGNLAHAAGFEAQIQRLGLVGRVFFLGQLDDVQNAYKAADCLAHPTLEDTFGMVVLEAMAHGLPVIVSAEAYCGLSGLLTHDQNALILKDPRDVASLTTQLQAVLSDAPLRARLTRQANTFAQPYKWSNLYLDQESIYFSCL